jgi:type IV secretion system protein VirD4
MSMTTRTGDKRLLGLCRFSVPLLLKPLIQAFGVNDHATADMLSRTIGDTTLEYDTVSTSRGTGWGENRAGPSESVSAHVTARRLATPDEIMRMRPDQVLLLRQGEHPLAVEKIRYYDQREFAGLFDPA